MPRRASLRATGSADSRPMRTSRMAADTLRLSSSAMASPTVRQEYTASAPASLSPASSSDRSKKSSSTARTVSPLNNRSLDALPVLSRLATVKLRQRQFDSTHKAIRIEILMDGRTGNGVFDQACPQPPAGGLLRLRPPCFFPNDDQKTLLVPHLNGPDHAYPAAAAR